jgi:ketosteroid isomerase-like protein
LNTRLVAVIVLAAGLVALGAWALVDRSTGSPETDAAQIVDDLNAAVNAGDATALRELFAPDAVFRVSTGDLISGRANVVNTVLTPHAVGLRVERAASMTTEGDTAATFTKVSNGTEGLELLVLRFEDGKIVRMWVYNEGFG